MNARGITIAIDHLHSWQSLGGGWLFGPSHKPRGSTAEMEKFQITYHGGFQEIL